MDLTRYYPPGFSARIAEERIVPGHGAGGRKMHRLIAGMFLRYFGNPVLERLEDGAAVRMPDGELCFTTDTYVVQPVFFSGGDIGKLAVCGTVNDLAVMGARPQYISVGFVLREGLRLANLEKICRSIARTARRAGVQIVTGDTKVIEQEGKGGEELFINTSGVGVRPKGMKLGLKFVKPGDLVLINGGIGEHEAAVAISRGEFQLRARLHSDCAPLNRMIASALRCGGIKLMRDPTRGGLATTLCEFARNERLGFIIEEALVPVSAAVRGVSEFLGIDPLYMANEGKVVMVVAPERGRRILKTLRRFPEGKSARVIGRVVAEPVGVWLKTRLGSLRRLLMLEGEQLPRIC